MLFRSSSVPLITAELKPKLHGYLWGIIRGSGGVPIAINGTEDHVHLLLGLKPDVCVADTVRTLKANSSKWAHDNHRTFGWQLGYAALSVSKSNVPAVAKYIAEQERHHRKMGFQQELVAFLQKHGIDYDERYIWQ